MAPLRPKMSLILYSNTGLYFLQCCLLENHFQITICNLQTLTVNKYGTYLIRAGNSLEKSCCRWKIINLTNGIAEYLRYKRKMKVGNGDADQLLEKLTT